MCQPAIRASVSAGNALCQPACDQQHGRQHAQGGNTIDKHGLKHAYEDATAAAPGSYRVRFSDLALVPAEAKRVQWNGRRNV